MTTTEQFQCLQRPRRNRKSLALRNLLQENRLHPHDFVVPLFIVDGFHQKQTITSLPGVYRYSLDLMLKEVTRLHQLGVQAIDLFPVIPAERKDEQGSEAVRPHNLVSQAVQILKKELPDLCVMVDIALDPYTSHGHDGLVNSQGKVLNDETLQVLGEMALLLAEAGVDVIAPSDMMDGRVRYLRELLDRANGQDVNILAYTAKYASAFYGPFREALNSAPKFGDKKTYQMNCANQREASLEALLDNQEGADMLLVKPALPYLDVLYRIKQETYLPVGAYHVSGEYAMVMAAAERGWINAPQAFYESLLSIKRAGADFIFTYAADQLLTQGLI